MFCLRHQPSIKWANDWTRAINRMNNLLTLGVLPSYFAQMSCSPLILYVFSISTIVSLQLRKVIQWGTRFHTRLPNAKSNSQGPRVRSKVYNSTANHAGLQMLHTLFLPPVIEDGVNRSHYPSHIRIQRQREGLSTARHSARSASSLTIQLL